MKPIRNRVKKLLDRHFMNRINKIDSYREVPKLFRQRGFTEQMFDIYNKEGQFFSVKSPDELYLVLLKDNGTLLAMSSMMEEVSAADIESDLKINFLNIEIKDVLLDYLDEE